MKRKPPMKPPRCGAKTRKGTPCAKEAGWGTEHLGVGRCKLHGGAEPHAQVNGMVLLARREMGVMGMPLSIEPQDAILECIRITAGAVAYASERVFELEQASAVGPTLWSRVTTVESEEGSETTETREGPPAVNIWIAVRDQEMDRLVQYSAAALKAGVQERLVKVAEGQAQQIADAMRRFAVALGHDPADPKVREGLRASLTIIAGGRAAA